jgi:hypothetical protein
MNIITFLKTHIPSFEDEFVQSESEREMENAPASARRRGSWNSRKGETFHEEEDNFLPGSVDPTESLGV